MSDRTSFHSEYARRITLLILTSCGLILLVAWGIHSLHFSWLTGIFVGVGLDACFVIATFIYDKRKRAAFTRKLREGAFDPLAYVEPEQEKKEEPPRSTSLAKRNTPQHIVQHSEEEVVEELLIVRKFFRRRRS